MVSAPEVETVCDGLAFPEGPVVLPDGDVLLVEIAAERLTRVRPDGRKTVVAALPGGPNGAALGPDGACYVCNNGGLAWRRFEGGLRPAGTPETYRGGAIQRVDLASGAVETLHTACGDTPLRGPNDLVFGADGLLWFTDHGKVEGRRMDLGAVFCAAPDGGFIREAAYPLLGPNGIGLSPDDATLIVAETPTGRLWAYPVEEGGALRREDWMSPTGGRLLAAQPGFQRYDSLAVEADGGVAVATLRRGGVASIGPDGAERFRLDLPDPYVTNIAFGGPDMRTAWITLSSAGLLVRTRWPHPGHPPHFSGLG